MVEVNKAGGGNTARTQKFSCLCVYGWPRVTLINEIMAPGPTHSRTEVSNVSRRGVGGYLRSFALHAFVPFCRDPCLSPRTHARSARRTVRPRAATEPIAPPWLR